MSHAFITEEATRRPGTGPWGCTGSAGGTWPGESAVTARRRVRELLDVNPATLRGWVERAGGDWGTRPGTTTETAAELAGLRRESAEVRRANEILKTASAFFAAAELDRRLR
ncbi:MAG: transposase [Acidimicrobiales bacterium]